MTDSMRAGKFVENLQNMSFANVFNPYSDRCAVYDLHNAPRIRSITLTRVLEAAITMHVDALWIGRDLGYRGGRRTGLAFTDDAHLQTHADVWRVAADRATAGEPITERSATVIWKALNDIKGSIFLWNVFPLHPHLPFNSFTNRIHSRAERHWGSEVLSELIELIKPTILVPIGKDAATAIARLDTTTRVYAVRHPSFGGMKQFNSQIKQCFSS